MVYTWCARETWTEMPLKSTFLEIFMIFDINQWGEKKQATFCNVLGASPNERRKKTFSCLVSPKNKLLIKLAIDREREEIEIPCASSNYSEINLRMGKQNQETRQKTFFLGLRSNWRTNTGGQFLEDYPKFSFFYPLHVHCAVYTSPSKRKGRKNRYYKKALHIHKATGGSLSQALSLFLGLDFPCSPKIQKNEEPREER